MSAPCMQWDHVCSSREVFDNLNGQSKGTLMAKEFPFAFADGYIFKIYSPDKKESFDMRVTGSYQNMVDPNRYSIELEKL